MIERRTAFGILAMVVGIVFAGSAILYRWIALIPSARPELVAYCELISEIVMYAAITMMLIGAAIILVRKIER